MFERRLKIFLGILFAAALLLLARAGQVQIVQGDRWRAQAAETVKRTELIETGRGRLLDYKGREIAADSACIDACVMYPAIKRDPKWIEETALKRLKSRLGSEYTRAEKSRRAAMLRDEIARVQQDIQAMWGVLAKIAGQSLEQIEEIRRATENRVEMRRRYVWYSRYAQAMDNRGKNPSSVKWLRFLLDDSATIPELDSFAITVAEENESHAILRAISPEVYNFLGKEIERYPGLELKPSTHRIYPFGATGGHLLGHLSRISKEDMQLNTEMAGTMPQDELELRQYMPNDFIGRTGLEALCEKDLRGMRGQLNRVVGNADAGRVRPPVPGKDVRCSIDFELQRQVEMIFRNARWKNPDGTIQTNEMHGAAIVIDVPTGEVRVLASVPTFDPNTLDDNYAQLAADEINKPLLNRATQAQLEPGSTVKPMVGIGGITQGVLRPDETIECTGFLMLGGHKQTVGKCWVATRFFKELNGHVAHHPVPTAAPHSTGFLTFPEGEERSCNIFFETVADRLGLDGLSHWYSLFGLGRPTGIGIAEAKGRLPNSFHGPAHLRRMTAWFSGIGQGQVAATPIQMANVAATIARNGIWMRPRLTCSEETQNTKSEIRNNDVVDLHLSPEALRLCREGMTRVVNGRAGTGSELKRDDMLVAGKTGTAQAAKFSIILRDPAGKPLRDEKGQIRRQFFEPNAFPWYRGTGSSGRDLAHAWFIGFAPADNPKVAFAVMVEYGGSGGHAAGIIARNVLDACIEHGYLK